MQDDASGPKFFVKISNKKIRNGSLQTTISAYPFSTRTANQYTKSNDVGCEVLRHKKERKKSKCTK